MNALKSLMKDPAWPVMVVLSGTHKLEDILDFDPQLWRRVCRIVFEHILPDRDAEEVAGLVAAYAETAKVKTHEDILGVAFAKRLIHASAGNLA